MLDSKEILHLLTLLIVEQFDALDGDDQQDLIECLVSWDSNKTNQDSRDAARDCVLEILSGNDGGFYEVDLDDDSPL